MAYMEDKLKDLIAAALSNPHFNFHDEVAIKESLNAIKDFYEKCKNEKNEKDELPVSFV